MGEAETKEVDGKMWHWCTHCGFWWLSYGSATHNDPATLPQRPHQPTQLLPPLLLPQPSNFVVIS